MSSIQKTLWENVSRNKLKLSLKGKYYRLNEWPNFGFSKYSPDFIILSAHLTKKFINKDELLKLVDTEEYVVDHFLNAASLLQILEVSDQQSEFDIPQNAASGFTIKLKKLFGFI